jgi:hypothetical protein
MASRATLGPPPYTLESFNVHNPDHAAYAEELLEEIDFLSTRVYGEDSEGPMRLLAQAVRQGTMPVAALDLRPQWKERVLAALGPQASACALPEPPAASAGRAPSPGPGPASAPSVII